MIVGTATAASHRPSAGDGLILYRGVRTRRQAAEKGGFRSRRTSVHTTPDRSARAAGALWGLFLGDALAMPVHWYYDRAALRRDYGEVRELLAPRNPHPGSILYRSRYMPPDPEADILHGEARYWGQEGIHYHQHLAAGENTLNLRLAQLLLDTVAQQGHYDPDVYLDRMVAFLRDPASHRDTYVEEWARAFFERRAAGVPLRQCGIREKHIGGLAGPVALLVALHADPPRARVAAHVHRELTHRGPAMAEALDAVADVLLPVLDGTPLREAIDTARRGGRRMLAGAFERWERSDDLEVIGRTLSPACYVEDAVPAVFHLARKYAEQPEEGLVANTMVGGDNCHRGAVLGALLGAACGTDGWPERWRAGLRYAPPAVPRQEAQG
jgi:ADP-ribosylglycohydrolase